MISFNLVTPNDDSLEVADFLGNLKPFSLRCYKLLEGNNVVFLGKLTEPNMMKLKLRYGHLLT